MNECDFCGSESEYLISINGGAWAVCSPCNDIVHIQMSVINRAKDCPTKQSKRYNIYGEEE